MTSQLARDLAAIAHQHYVTPSTTDQGPSDALTERMQERLKDRPKIVCICGSSRFADWAAVNSWNFSKMGIIVLSYELLPQWYWEATNKVGHGHAAEQEGVADILDALHLKKIEMADEVFIINKDGYIGERTWLEINYAKSLGKPVSYMEPWHELRKAVET